LAAVPSFLLLLALQASPPSVEFQRGKVAFDRGEYGRAIEVLRPLLYPEPRLQTEGEIATAHRMLGVAHLFERQNDQATQEFRKFLQLRPDYRMDPLIDPPLVVDFFNGVLKQQEAELAELGRLRQEAEADERRRREGDRAVPQLFERRFVRNSLAVAFLPFGAGQFQNGHRTKGWVFLGSQSLLAGISTAAFATNFALYGARPVIQCEPAPAGTRGPGCGPGYRPNPDQARSQLLLKVQLVSGALFFAAAIWGVTDAILNFQPEVEITPSDQSRSVQAGLPDWGGKAPTNSPRVGLSPRFVFTSTDGGWGGALAFRF
jgi:hypothetical protein